MTVDERLIFYWAKNVRDDLVTKTMNFLIQQNDLTSGDDTCLENNWEEYCVQVQDEKSIAWDDYQDHIEMLLRGYFEELPEMKQLTLWLYCDAGIDWYFDENRAQDVVVEDVPIMFDDCLREFMSAVNELAMDYNNENIECYLHRFEEEIEDNEEDEK
jgi:hypothetical protein